MKLSEIQKPFVDVCFGGGVKITVFIVLKNASTTMKTTKNKSSANSKNQPSSTIQKHFKTAQNGSNECVPSNVKSVYVHALLEKLNRFDDDIDSSNESNSVRENTVAISSTPKPTTDRVEVKKSNRCEACGRVDKSNGCGECDKWRLKYEEVKKSQIKLSLKYTNLVLKYDEMVEVAKGTVRPNFEPNSDGISQASDDISQAMASSNVSQTMSACSGVSQAMSASGGVSQAVPVIDDIFTVNEIKCLDCLPLDISKDSTFVLHCIQYAYKGNLASLTTKTLKGTKARFEIDESGDAVVVKPGKNPLTPEKVQRFQQLFIDRVTKSKCLAGEFGERVKVTNFNKLIANALKNVTNKEAPKVVLSNPNADLNL